jgi:hypothetical protein
MEDFGTCLWIQCSAGCARNPYRTGASRAGLAHYELDSVYVLNIYLPRNVRGCYQNLHESASFDHLCEQMPELVIVTAPFQ